jgi:hypothetical protein
VHPHLSSRSLEPMLLLSFTPTPAQVPTPFLFVLSIFLYIGSTRFLKKKTLLPS